MIGISELKPIYKRLDNRQSELADINSSAKSIASSIKTEIVRVFEELGFRGNQYESFVHLRKNTKLFSMYKISVFIIFNKKGQLPIDQYALYHLISYIVEIFNKKLNESNSGKFPTDIIDHTDKIFRFRTQDTYANRKDIAKFDENGFPMPYWKYV